MQALFWYQVHLYNLLRKKYEENIGCAYEHYNEIATDNIVTIYLWQAVQMMQKDLWVCVYWRSMITKIAGSKIDALYDTDYWCNLPTRI